MEDVKIHETVCVTNGISLVLILRALKSVSYHFKSLSKLSLQGCWHRFTPAISAKVIGANSPPPILLHFTSPPPFLLLMKHQWGPPACYGCTLMSLAFPPGFSPAGSQRDSGLEWKTIRSHTNIKVLKIVFPVSNNWNIVIESSLYAWLLAELSPQITSQSHRGLEFTDNTLYVFLTSPNTWRSSLGSTWNGLLFINSLFLLIYSVNTFTKCLPHKGVFWVLDLLLRAWLTHLHSII